MSPKKAGKQPQKDFSGNRDHPKGAPQDTNAGIEIGDLTIGISKRAPLIIEDRLGKKPVGTPASGPSTAAHGVTNMSKDDRKEKRTQLSSPPILAALRLTTKYSDTKASERPTKPAVRPVRADEGSQRDTAGLLSRKTRTPATISKTMGEPRTGDAASGSKRPGRK